MINTHMINIIQTLRAFRRPRKEVTITVGRVRPSFSVCGEYPRGFPGGFPGVSQEVTQGVSQRVSHGSQ